MPFFFVCYPAADYEMFHDNRDAMSNFDKCIIEADSIDEAIASPEYEDIDEVFAIEVATKKSTRISSEWVNNKIKQCELDAQEKELAEAENKRAERRALYKDLKKEFGEK